MSGSRPIQEIFTKNNDLSKTEETKIVIQIKIKNVELKSIFGLNQYLKIREPLYG